MAKKTIKKKKAYARDVHETVKKGFINTSDGKWVTRNQSFATETIKNMYFSGRKVS